MIVLAGAAFGYCVAGAIQLWLGKETGGEWVLAGVSEAGLQTSEYTDPQMVRGQCFREVRFGVSSDFWVRQTKRNVQAYR